LLGPRQWGVVGGGSMTDVREVSRVERNVMKKTSLPPFFPLCRSSRSDRPRLAARLPHKLFAATLRSRTRKAQAIAGARSRSRQCRRLDHLCQGRASTTQVEIITYETTPPQRSVRAFQRGVMMTRSILCIGAISAKCAGAVSPVPRRLRRPHHAGCCVQRDQSERSTTIMRKSVHLSTAT